VEAGRALLRPFCLLGRRRSGDGSNDGRDMFWPWKKTSAQIDAQPTSPATAAEDDAVNILRYLRNECIRLDLAFEPSLAPEDESDQQRERRLVGDKERLIQELCDILDQSGEIINPTKFYKDMVNRERKATTAIAPGIAIPHVRSMQCRAFIMGFARSRQGVHFASLDGKPTRVFFLMSSPPYEDKIYLKVYRQIAEMFQEEWVLDALAEATDTNEVLNILRGFLS
jgi:mannitol/fructose-specific phosphotransferase system IIA component (Ntr-type)